MKLHSRLEFILTSFHYLTVSRSFQIQQWFGSFIQKVSGEFAQERPQSCPQAIDVNPSLKLKSNSIVS